MPCADVHGFGSTIPAAEYESLRAQGRQQGPALINLSSFIAFHARRTPDRCALKYRGEEISFAVFDRRIGKAAGLTDANLTQILDGPTASGIAEHDATTISAS